MSLPFPPHLTTRFALHTNLHAPGDLLDGFSVGYWFPLATDSQELQEKVEPAIRLSVQVMLARAIAGDYNLAPIAGPRCNVLYDVQQRIQYPLRCARLTSSARDAAIRQGWIPVAETVGHSAFPFAIGVRKEGCVQDIVGCLIVQSFLQSLQDARSLSEQVLRESAQSRYFYELVRERSYERVAHGRSPERVDIIEVYDDGYMKFLWTLNLFGFPPVSLMVGVDSTTFRQGGLVVVESVGLPMGHRKFLPDVPDLHYLPVDQHILSTLRR